MFRLAVALLVFLMGDWIFFDAGVALRPLMAMLEAGAEILADLIVRFAG